MLALTLESYLFAVSIIYLPKIKMMKRYDKQAGNLLYWIVEEDFKEGQEPSSYQCELFRQLDPNMDDPDWKIVLGELS